MTGSAVKILVVDDEPPIRKLLRVGLTAQGYDVNEAASAGAALQSATDDPPDLIVLDLGLPDKPGHDLLREWREAGLSVPVVILSSRTDEAGIVKALETGADDYVTKPFAMTELAARIRAVLRRLRPGLAEDRVRRGDIVIDRVAHRVKRGASEIHLGPTEFRLLDYLMQHPGRVFSREQLLDAVWGSDVYVEARTVDVHIGRLRKALGVSEVGDPIRTVRSAGYSLDLDA
jgi:two-component system phosphate regulon response regulator PhoB